MKTLPTVIASRSKGVAILVDQFEGSEGVPNRDAVDFVFRGKTVATGIRRPFSVRFSGTVMIVRAEAFGLPSLGDRESTFRTFAEAAIGDALDVTGPIELGGPDDYLTVIDCFSPHFQGWRDRPPASDDEVEQYLFVHVVAAWDFAQVQWELGPSDLLRLNRTLPDVMRLVRLHAASAWSISNESTRGATLTPLNSFVRDRRAARQAPETKAVQPKDAPVAPVESVPPSFVFVDEARIADLRRLDSAKFDLRKLLALCEELNQCYRAQCYHAVAALTRALLDHVPPIFGKTKFSEVANNVGPKSFKEAMQHLENGARNIGDQHLHGQVRERETLPTRVQVDFSHTVDLLLGEIVRRLESKEVDSAVGAIGGAA